MFYSEHTLRITTMYVMWRILEVMMCRFVHERGENCVYSDGMVTSCGWSKAVCVSDPQANSYRDIQLFTAACEVYMHS